MARTAKPPTIVAELGRPETSAETAARKAEQSRLYRQRKTVNNLVFSLLVSVAMVFVMVLIVPRGTDQWGNQSIDVAKAAQQHTASAGITLLAPQVPSSWKAKQALLRQHGELSSWYIGYTTENETYAAVVQAFTGTGEPVSASWVSDQLETQAATGSERIGDLTWIVYDHPNRSPDNSNVMFALETTIADTVLLVYGTDRPEVLRTLAAEVASEARRLS